jgi:hypothetical protein
MCVAACATTSSIPGATAPHWPSLARFSSEQEFLSYLDAVGRAQAAARRLYEHRHKQADPEAQAEPCPTELAPCEDAEQESIVVTGARVAAQPSPQAVASITNVQTAGVDEGDIVKLYGRFLIVLQDGRLFSVDTGASSRDLALVDRADVYRDPDADAWYDEILVHDDRVVVTGYNYGAEATEFSVFSIGDDGRFTREGTYFLSSNDYYDSENYATRLVNGNLVIYTPLDVSEMGSEDRPKWPLVRRWVREDDADMLLSPGRRLFEARDIYRPVQETLDPYVHTISVCPLGSARAGDELDCRSTAVVGGPWREFYVSNDHIYLWLSASYDYYMRRQNEAACAARTPGSFEYAGPAALYQISLRNGRPRAMFVRGAPYDQLGMEATADEFRALAVWIDGRCDDEYEDLPLRYFSTRFDAFSTTPRPAPAERFTPVPSPGGSAMENRFAQGYLVYGGRSSWGSYPPSRSIERQTARVVTVPTDRPNEAVVLEAPHNVIRVESLGTSAIVTGYRDSEALSISLVDLRAAPRIASTALLTGRYESEGRSHAFNATVGADGAGLMGLPTVEVRSRSGRWWWNSESSDVSFLSFDANGALASLGVLATRAESAHPGYACEVSCIDWYGNSRPIFIGARVFALSGTELIEGKVDGGRIEELGRVNLTAPYRSRQ